MNRMKPWILTAAAAAFALSFVAVASAQSPPGLPVIFEGTVSASDDDVAAGLPVEAYVGDGAQNCNNRSTETFKRGGQTRYWVEVVSNGQTSGCGVEGTTVRFKIGDRWATQTGTWTGHRNTLNLTLGTAAPTSVNVDVTVWRSVRTGSIFVSTRPEGAGWTTHNTPVDLSQLSGSGNFYQGSPVAVEVDLQ